MKNDSISVTSSRLNPFETKRIPITSNYNAILKMYLLIHFNIAPDFHKFYSQHLRAKANSVVHKALLGYSPRTENTIKRCLFCFSLQPEEKKAFNVSNGFSRVYLFCHERLFSPERFRIAVWRPKDNSYGNC